MSGIVCNVLESLLMVYARWGHRIVGCHEAGLAHSVTVVVGYVAALLAGLELRWLQRSRLDYLELVAEGRQTALYLFGRALLRSVVGGHAGWAK